MKKFTLVIIAMILLAILVVSLTACDTDGDGTARPSDPNKGVQIESILNGEVSGDECTLEVSPSTIAIDLSGSITVSNGCSWQLYEDALHRVNIPTKNAVNLVDGDNTYYIVVTSKNGKISRTYTLNIWKNFRVNIEFVSEGKIVKKFTRETHQYFKENEFPSPRKTGYSFIGWTDYTGGDFYLSASGDNYNGITYTYTFTAQFSANSYTITLDGNGGNCSKDCVEVTYDSNFELPMLSRTGYTFDGWKFNGKKITNSDGSSIKSFTFSKNIIATAVWIANCYNLTVNKDGNYGSVTASGSKECGSSVTITATPNAGYAFAGWYNGETKVSESASYTFTMPANDVEYTAKWTMKTYTITLDSDGAECNIQTQIVTYNQDYTLPVLTREGHTFGGWSINGVKIVNVDGTSVSKYHYLRDITATAIWTVNSYYVKIVNENGNYGSVTSSGSKEYGSSVTIVATPKGEYTFMGWYNGETKVSDDTNYTFTMPANNVEYAARWAAYYVTMESNMSDAGDCKMVVGNSSITFNLNGGSGTAPATQYSNIAIYPTTIPTRSGYVFAGWYANKACTGSPYDFTKEVKGQITLYAKWVSYTGSGVLTFNGSKSIQVVPQSSSKAYYAFVPLTSGYITIYTTGKLDTCGLLYDSSKTQLAANDDGGDGSNFAITYKVVAGSLYYVRPCATFNKYDTTTVWLEGAWPQDGGSKIAPSTQMVTAGEIVTLTADTKDGYTWLGWYDGDTKVSEGTSLTYTFTMTTENETYTAKWKISSYTVTWKNYDGSVLETDENVTHGMTPSYDSGVPTREKDQQYTYTFGGWSPTVSTATADIVYTAQFKCTTNTYTVTWKNYDNSVLEIDENIEYGVMPEYNGHTPTRPTTIEHSYSFIGWNNTITSVTGDVEYVAVFVETDRIENLIVYDSNGGSSVDEIVFCETGKQIVLTSVIPQKEGYVFLGWLDSVSENVYMPNTRYSPVADVVFYAVWEKACAGCGGFEWCSLCLGSKGTSNTVECETCAGYGEKTVINYCTKCNGTGKEDPIVTYVKCHGCSGTGKLEVISQYECIACGSTTKYIDYDDNGRCWNCNGPYKTVYKQQSCSACGGSGQIKQTTESTQNCSNCKGNGYTSQQTVKCSDCDGTGEKEIFTPCSLCNGEGHTVINCDVCNGLGYEKSEYSASTLMSLNKNGILMCCKRKNIWSISTIL